MSIIQIAKKYTNQIKKREIELSIAIKEIESLEYQEGVTIESQDVVKIMYSIKKGLQRDEYLRGDGLSKLSKMLIIIDRYIEEHDWKSL